MRRPTALRVAVLAACGFTALAAIAAPSAGTFDAAHSGNLSRDARSGCVRSPGRFSVAPQSGATVTVNVGSVVYVELVEAEKYLSWTAGTKPPPPVFPWAGARSSDPDVLRPVALCPNRGISTLPVALYAFRTLRPGAATLEAPIVAAWRRVSPARRRGLHRYRVSVIAALTPVGSIATLSSSLAPRQPCGE
jgi:hypothetical protein